MATRAHVKWSTVTENCLRLERSSIDGVPVVWGNVPGPKRAALLFRVGQADESLPTRGITHAVEHVVLSRLGQQSYEWADGARMLISSDSFQLTVHPEAWKDGVIAAAAIDSGMDAELSVKIGKRQTIPELGSKTIRRLRSRLPARFAGAVVFYGWFVLILLTIGLWVGSSNCRPAGLPVTTRLKGSRWHWGSP